MSAKDTKLLCVYIQQVTQMTLTLSYVYEEEIMFRSTFYLNVSSHSPTNADIFILV